MTNFIKNFTKNYFFINKDIENEKLITDSITQGISFKGTNLWILIFAIFIASIGLNVNSTAVIIGAMLISPLMGPIIGMGFAVGINDLKLFYSALLNYCVATGISILTATIYFMVSPFDEAQSELLARTSPTTYDVFIAMFGGAAGIIAIFSKDKGNVIPGVAIATALMPPLCTAGYGIAHSNIYFFAGAFYLYFINTVFICASTYAGVRLMKFHQKEMPENIAKKSRRLILAIIIITIIPSVFLTYNVFSNNTLRRNVRMFVKEELNMIGVQAISHEIDEDTKTLKVAIVGNELSANEITHIEDKMHKYHIDEFKLKIIQGVQTDSIIRKNINNESSRYAGQFNEQVITIKKLQDQLNQYTQYQEITKTIEPEAKILFKNLKSAMVMNCADENSPQKEAIAIVELLPDTKTQKTDISLLKQWLTQRINADSLRIIISIDKENK
ncbi:MAG: DUF389 domain-containing protein [Bacteroidales bacterium]|nr:DUF389 domain-containing protein [Bacteroidales bacterium]